jgi:predicted ATP-binding protein involved in virulence
MLIEIAWRCYTLNPFLGKEAFAKTKGIVTIDEVDLHLHPKWQQRIVPILAEAFPNIQFVITTHSPIVLSSVKGNILRLEGDKVFVQQNLYGLKPSQVLEGFMQIQERLPQFRSDIQQYFTLINQEQGTSSEALVLRQKLENEISQNDPLFTEADALISFYSY